MALYSRFSWTLGLLLLGSSAYAASPKTLNLGLSLTSYQMNKLSQSKTGEPGTFGTNFYNFQVEYHLPVTPTVLFSPRLNYMFDELIPVEAPEKGSKLSLNFLTLPAVYNLNPMWDLSGGLSIMRYTVNGEGGTVELNNGTGTATFAKPGRTVTTTTFGLILGGALNYLNRRSGLDILIQSPLSAEQRSFSLVLSFTWGAYKSSGSAY